jgi:uncharacterized protein (TIGR04141 family)
MSREAAMRERDGVESFVVPPLDTELESLFVAAREAHPPWWAGFLAAHIAGDDLDDLFNASTSAALLVEADERLFALTSGTGATCWKQRQSSRTSASRSCSTLLNRRSSRASMREPSMS